MGIPENSFLRVWDPCSIILKTKRSKAGPSTKLRMTSFWMPQNDATYFKNNGTHFKNRKSFQIPEESFCYKRYIILIAIFKWKFWQVCFKSVKQSINALAKFEQIHLLNNTIMISSQTHFSSNKVNFLLTLTFFQKMEILRIVFLSEKCRANRHLKATPERPWWAS